jgi:hypothetical protein
MESSSTYALSSWLFLRLLALIYLVAFVSLAVQVRGLIGRHGMLPARTLRVAGFRQALRAYARVPTLCRWNASDAFLLAQCWGGAVLALALFAGVAPLPVLLTLWILYVSLTNACGIFLGYQWDALLAEMGLLAVLIAPAALWDAQPGYDPPFTARFVLLWLLFRLVFSSGVLKLRSGDVTWRRLAALRYHYETQPLPNGVSWYAHHLPASLHVASAVIMFAIELGAPVLVLLDTPLSYAGAIAIVVLMVLIEATGNYGFFNLQTAALCVLVVPDHAFPAALGAGLSPHEAPLWWASLVTAAAAVLFAVSLSAVVRLFVQDAALPRLLLDVLRDLAPFRIVNSYGLFAVMTTSRPEIVVEGSDDGVEWRAYELRWKPGDPAKRPRTVAPHQPRLDWQMWFAALGTITMNPWFVAFVQRLLEGSNDVLALLARNPFPVRPPQYVRALLYDYRLTAREERARTGQWWRRELLGLYCPPVRLQDLKD